MKCVCCGRELNKRGVRAQAMPGSACGYRCDTCADLCRLNGATGKPECFLTLAQKCGGSTVVELEPAELQLPGVAVEIATRQERERLTGWQAALTIAEREFCERVQAFDADVQRHNNGQRGDSASAAQRDQEADRRESGLEKLDAHHKELANKLLEKASQLDKREASLLERDRQATDRNKVLETWSKQLEGKETALVRAQRLFRPVGTPLAATILGHLLSYGAGVVSGSVLIGWLLFRLYNGH